MIRKNFFHNENFTEILKNLVIDLDLKIISLDSQNNYVGNSNMMSNAAKYFDILVISLSILHLTNILINILTKLFLDLYLAKFLDR